MVNPSDIADAFSDFNQSLHNLKNNQSTPQPNTSTIQTFLESVNLLTLSSSQMQSLSKPFSSSEIELAIKTLPAKKSPGGDGYTNEYYKFTSSISPHLSDLSLIYDLETKKTPSLLLSLDADKAFDLVHWDSCKQYWENLVSQAGCRLP